MNGCAYGIIGFVVGIWWEKTGENCRNVLVFQRCCYDQKDSGSCVRKDVEVQVLSPALKFPLAAWRNPLKNTNARWC